MTSSNWVGLSDWGFEESAKARSSASESVSSSESVLLLLLLLGRDVSLASGASTSEGGGEGFDLEDLDDLDLVCPVISPGPLAADVEGDMEREVKYERAW